MQRDDYNNFSIEYEVAKSGEVFYVWNGKLCKCDDTDEFVLKMYDEDEKLTHYNKVKSTFFTFETEEGKFKYNILSHDSIMRAINNVKDISKKVSLVQEYDKIKRSVL